MMQKEQHDKERFLALYGMVSKIFGNGILTRVKDYECVLGRRFIAYQMKEEGYSYSAIGRHLLRHHASVMHMCKMMEDVLEYPDIFKLEMAYWEEFQKKIKEYDIHSRTTQGS